MWILLFIFLCCCYARFLRYQYSKVVTDPHKYRARWGSRHGTFLACMKTGKFYTPKDIRKSG